jgi:hypothetical protein
MPLTRPHGSAVTAVATPALRVKSVQRACQSRHRNLTAHSTASITAGSSACEVPVTHHEQPDGDRTTIPYRRPGDARTRTSIVARLVRAHRWRVSRDWSVTNRHSAALRPIAQTQAGTHPRDSTIGENYSVLPAILSKSSPLSTMFGFESNLESRRVLRQVPYAIRSGMN